MSTLVVESSSSLWATITKGKKLVRKGQQQSRRRRYRCGTKKLVFLLLLVVAAISPAILFKMFSNNNLSSTTRNNDNDVNHLSLVQQQSSSSTTSGDRNHDDDKEEDYKMLPQWMKDYFVWHNKQRRALLKSTNNYNKSQYKFLILRCIQADKKTSCGGLSDRLKALPLLIWLSAKYNRIFLIYWNRPCQLEEFLIPPNFVWDGNGNGIIRGIDWRVPEFMKPMVDRGDGLYLRNLNRILEVLEKNKSDNNKEIISLLSVKIQDQHGGSEYYNNQQQKQMQQQDGGGNAQSHTTMVRAHRNVYGPLFRTLFEPSPGLAKALQAERRKYPALQLNDGTSTTYYDAVHLRALYVPPLPSNMVPDVTVNAINCASQFHPTTTTTTKVDDGGAIFFASDSVQALQVAKEYGEHLNKNTRDGHRRREIVVIDRGKKNPLHLDKATSRNPQDYYDVFLDMYHFANSRCISHGQGGFGRLGVLLSHNASCLFTFFKQGQILPCEWKA